MITQKKEIVGATELLHTYSDSFFITQRETGAEYEEAWDSLPCRYTYEESETPLPKKEDEGNPPEGHE